jgi:D-alanyl-D-alanine carboxypeptidase (penicillin-binding protein 5/6)
MKYLNIFIISLLFGNNCLAAKTIKTVEIYNKPIKTELVIDAKDGKILHEYNSREKIYPASLTKLMTLYLLFDALENHKIKMKTKFLVSYKAEKMKPSKLGLKSGEYINVQDVILALIVKSANDVAVVAAENLSGTENKFAKLMRITAKELGMNDSYFANASGWHDSSQKTTARDLAKLALAIKRDFPQYYSLFSKTNFNFRGKIIEGHNYITKNYDGAEGLKTGYTIPAGWNLVTTASRGNKTIVAVVTGGTSRQYRDNKMLKLLDKYFEVQNHTNNNKFAYRVKKTNKQKKTKFNIARLES